MPLDKIKVIKNALSLLSPGPTHHSFTFNSRFLYELRHKVHISETVCEIFHFRFRLVFIKVKHSFASQNSDFYVVTRSLKVQ